MKYWIIFLFFGIALKAQPKYDYNWVFGSDGYSTSGTLTDTNFGGTIIDFNDKTNFNKREQRLMNINITNASISSELGELLYYTNGCSVADNTGKFIKNGDSLYLGSFNQKKWKNGNVITSGALFLPNNYNKDHILLLHTKTVEKKISSVPTIFSDELFYSIISISENKVIKKNILFASDTFASPNFHAVLHENGKDWWVLCNTTQTKGHFFKFLITNDSISLFNVQNIGATILDSSNVSGQFAFSRKGDKFAYFDAKLQLHLFDFNRENAFLSNYKQLKITDTSYIYGGVAFSPSGRFLYISNLGSIYQMDLLSSNMLESKVEVAKWDGYRINDFFPTNFGRFISGPDCKLFLNTIGSSYYMHVINHPDRKGVDCDVHQRAIKTTWMYSSTPNFPNFRAGTPYENYCDTITSTGTPILYFAPNVKVYPNPVQEMMQIEVLGLQSWRTGTFKLFDSMGRLVQAHALTADAGPLEINTLSLPKGIYAWSVYLEGFGVQSGKVIKP